MRSTALGVAFLTLACGGGGDGGPMDPDPEPTDGFPALLSDLQRGTAIQLFEPQFVLWTNGLDKARTIAFLGDGRVDATTRAIWSFPDGTQFTKTFSYRPAASPGQIRNVETRVIRRVGNAWDVAVYLWRDDQSDADLQDGANPVPVDVADASGRSYTHLVPSTGQCFTCHAGSPAFILGFRELQLNSVLPGENATQLERLHQAGIFETPMPGSPDDVPEDDPLTEAVLGYVEVNCVHCHNGFFMFDLSHSAFVGNTVGKVGPSGATLLTPGDPDASEVYLRMAAGTMPPLGVQLEDTAGLDRLRQWILTHDFGTN